MNFFRRLFGKRRGQRYAQQMTGADKPVKGSCSYHSLSYRDRDNSIDFSKYIKFIKSVFWWHSGEAYGRYAPYKYNENSASDNIDSIHTNYDNDHSSYYDSSSYDEISTSRGSMTDTTQIIDE